MSIFDKFTSQEDREIMARTVFLEGGEREIGRPVEFSLVAREQEKIVKVHPGGVEEIEKRGDYRRYFRCGGLDFLTLRAAVKMALANLLSASPAAEKVTVEDELREKLRGEMLGEIKAHIGVLENSLISKLSETLLKPGPFREVLICGNDLLFTKREHLEQDREDLKARLAAVFGDDSTLLLAYWLRPQIFERAVESLPQGKSEGELLAERQESAKRDLERHRGRIQEVRDYLKKLK